MNEKQKIIIKAAQTVLIREGGRQFSARKVAAEAGMSLGNLQYHYKTKLDLLTGVLETYLTAYQRVFEQFAEQSTTGWNGLAQLVNLVLAGEGSPDDEKLFQALALHMNEPGMDTQLSHFFGTVHGFAENCFDIIVEKQCSKAEIKQAANLFVIYIEGNELLKPYISTDKGAAQQLTTLLGHILRLQAIS